MGLGPAVGQTELLVMGLGPAVGETTSCPVHFLCSYCYFRPDHMRCICMLMLVC